MYSICLFPSLEKRERDSFFISECLISVYCIGCQSTVYKQCGLLTGGNSLSVGRRQCIIALLLLLSSIIYCNAFTPPSQIQTAAPLYNQPNLQRFELRRRYYHTYFFVTIICAGCAHVRRCAAYLIYIRTK